MASKKKKNANQPEKSKPGGRKNQGWQKNQAKDHGQPTKKVDSRKKSIRGGKSRGKDGAWQEYKNPHSKQTKKRGRGWTSYIKGKTKALQKGGTDCP